jgi:hypothetical protein
LRYLLRIGQPPGAAITCSADPFFGAAVLPIGNKPQTFYNGVGVVKGHVSFGVAGRGVKGERSEFIADP